MECTPAKPLSRSSLMTDKTLKKLQEKLLLRVSGPKVHTYHCYSETRQKVAFGGLRASTHDCCPISLRLLVGWLIPPSRTTQHQPPQRPHSRHLPPTQYGTRAQRSRSPPRSSCR